MLQWIITIYVIDTEQDIVSFSLLVWELVCDICSLVSMVFQVALSLLLCNSNLIILDCQLVFN